MKRTSSCEIERKFLLKDLPEEASGTVCRRIKQGYLAVERDREVRLRSMDDKYYLTVKTGKGLSRGEVETEISKVQFMGLWPLTAGRRVEKLRFEFTNEYYVFELDVFEGELEGLKLAEVEFSSVLESRRFAVPPYFGEEVTDDESFNNKTLAIKGLPDYAKLTARRATTPRPKRESIED